MTIQIGMKQQLTLNKQDLQQQLPKKLVKPAQAQYSRDNPYLQVQNILGNHGVLNRSGFPSIQAKLKIGESGDVYEQEADRVADAVMKMPDPQIQRQEEEEDDKIQMKPVAGQISPLVQRKEKRDEDEPVQMKPLAGQISPLVQRKARREEDEDDPIQMKPPTGQITPKVQLKERRKDDEEDPIQMRKISGQISGTYHTDDAPQIINEVLRSQGQDLDLPTRDLMEKSFNQDFGQVRVHLDELAEESAQMIGAQAYTSGNHIVFGHSQYMPETIKGQSLIAHELAHVIQQKGSRVNNQFQCKKLPDKEFNFTSSTIAIKINEELSKIKAPSTANNKQEPLIDPKIVINILCSSKEFLSIAKLLESLYFPTKGKPNRTPPLNFRFHEDITIGSHFKRSTSQIVVEVSTLENVVRRIVHEVVHASHSNPAIANRSITKIEEAGIEEESRTRDKENSIMQEIAVTQNWRNVNTPSGKNEVRSDLKSGLPVLTYQEFFIIEEMQKKTRVPSISENDTMEVAKKLHPTGLNDIKESLTKKKVEYHKRMALNPDQEKVPERTEALSCVKKIQNYPNWRRALEKHESLPSEALKEFSSSCVSFLEYGYRQIDLINPEEMIDRLISKLKEKKAILEIQKDESGVFMKWYKSVPKKKQKAALVNLEWYLIAEAFSYDWQDWLKNKNETSKKIIRNKHMKFLHSCIGKSLKGITIN